MFSRSPTDQARRQQDPPLHHLLKLVEQKSTRQDVSPMHRLLHGVWGYHLLRPPLASATLQRSVPHRSFLTHSIDRTRSPSRQRTELTQSQSTKQVPTKPEQ